MNNILKNIVIDTEATVGNKLLLLEVRPCFTYKEGVKGEQEGLTFTVLSERMNYEKANIKIAGITNPPFEFNAPIPVQFEGLEAKLWQDWNEKGMVKISFTAKNVKPLNTQKIKLGGEK